MRIFIPRYSLDFQCTLPATCCERNEFRTVGVDTNQAFMAQRMNHLQNFEPGEANVIVVNLLKIHGISRVFPERMKESRLIIAELVRGNYRGGFLVVATQPPPKLGSTPHKHKEAGEHQN